VGDRDRVGEEAIAVTIDLLGGEPQTFVGEFPGAGRILDLVDLPKAVVRERDSRRGIAVSDPGQFAGIGVVAASLVLL